MKRLLIAAVAALLPLSALAAPRDWTAYLCKWGQDGQTLLVKVNPKDGRVLVHDHDAQGVTIKPDYVFFETPRGTFEIRTPSLALMVTTFIGAASIEHGACKIVDDSR